MIATLYRRRLGEDPAAAKLLAQLQQQGYSLTGLQLETVHRVEGVGLSDLTPLHPLLGSPVVDRLSPSSMLVDELGIVREITYLRAMTDPEMDSLVAAAEMVDLQGVKWYRQSTRYQFEGVSPEVADQITSRFLYNPQIQTVLGEGEEWPTLIPQGESWPVVRISMDTLNDDDLVALSDWRRLHMPLPQLKAVQDRFVNVEKRAVRDGEIETIAAKWSDHCNHNSLRALKLFQRIQGSTFAIDHPLVKSAFVDNSGVMIFYGGWCLCIKGETHISPTFAGSPYGGIMTMHGGVIRDILWTGQGAWPFAGMKILATADPRIDWVKVPKGAIHPAIVLRESIRGTHDYTNPMGIPTAWSRYLIDEANWKGVALGHSIGVIPEERALKGEPRPGDFVMLIGGLTGNDGLHGATVSSAGMTAETSTVDAAHVQIGMPIEERVMMEVMPRLRDADCTRAGTDCGAAGLESAVSELGENGVWMNLAVVPLKCAGMQAWQILMSESQERAVTAVPPAKVEQALQICATYGLRATIIGVFTETKRFQVVYSASNADYHDWPCAVAEESIVVDLDCGWLKSGCPLPVIEVADPVVVRRPKVTVPTIVDWPAFLREYLGDYNIADQSYAAHRYDQTVQGNTVLPYIGGRRENMLDDLSVFAPVRGKPWGAGVAVSVNQQWTKVDPYVAGQLLMAEAQCRLVAAGFSPDDITCNVNVCTPKVTDSPLNARRLVDLVHGYCDAAEVLRMPVISGKDSSSCTFTTSEGERIDAPLTCAVASLGRMPNVEHVLPKAFQRVGEHLMVFSPGLQDMRFGGSILANRLGLQDELPEFDLRKFRHGLARYHGVVSSKGIRLITSRSVVSRGGLIRRLFEMGVGAELGCRLNLAGRFTLADWLFGEYPSIVFTSPAWAAAGIQRALGDDCQLIGEVIAAPVVELGMTNVEICRVSLASLEHDWSRTFREVAA